MTGRVYVNNYRSSISAAITDSATTAYITSSVGLPTLSGSEYYYLTLSDGINYEVVKVTARTSLTLTIVRAQDNSTARAWSANTPIEMRFTQSSVVDWTDATANISTTGTITGGQVNADNLRLDANAITSTNTNGSITITPNGTGDLVLDGLKWPQADGTADYVLKTNGAAQLSWVAQTAGITDIVQDTTPQLGGNLDVNGNSIVSVSNGNISITPNGTGKIILDGLSWPTADGSASQVLVTDGAGNLSFSAGGGGGGLGNVVEDTTPQLGGNLDVNGQSIVSVSNGNITITPNGTGSVVLDGLNWPQADGTSNQVLKTNGSGQLSFTTVGGVSVDFQSFTSGSGTWTAPSGGQTMCKVVMYGGGGGGGAGASLATAVVAKGGGGGGGGAYNERIFKLSDLGGSQSYSVGAGGSAGTPGAAGAAGGDGGAGGTSTFGTTTLMSAFGGGGGRGGAISGVNTFGGGGGSRLAAGAVGTTAAAAGGGPNNLQQAYGSAGANSTSSNASNSGSEYGGAGGGGSNSAGSTGAGQSSLFGGCGGGSGGCHSSTPAVIAGSAGGTYGTYTAGGGGAVGTDGASPTAGTAGADGFCGRAGQGGGGGGTTVTASTNGAAGGAGGLCGGGGGGGGVGNNPGLGGSGGAGGSGAIFIVCW